MSRRLQCLTAVLCCALLATACGAPHHTDAVPRPPVIPGQATGPDLAGVQIPNFIMPIIYGGVSRPKHQLTPGAVTTTNANKICNLPGRLAVPTIPTSVQSAVFDSYGYTTPAAQRKHILDLLVPITLGGSVTVANIWPAAVEGTGFFQKSQLDGILKNLVCRRQVTLTQAQHALETDWYVAWLKYVVATGHI
jgi:hypothetical protein